MPDPNLYTVGWICAIPTELVAATAFLEEKHDEPGFLAQNDNNTYTLGRIWNHNVVIACAPDGEYGTQSAAAVARDMMHSFPNIRIGLMVGIAGGVPSSKHDIRLGDVVVSAPRDGKGGVVQYDFGKQKQNQDFSITGFLNQPPTLIRIAVGALRAQYESDGHKIKEHIIDALAKKPRLRKKYAQPGAKTDTLCRSSFVHPIGDERTCAEVCFRDSSNCVTRNIRTEDEDDPMIHYGLIASGNSVMKDADFRDLAAHRHILAFEMEAAGLMNHFPCLVIRGICDYSDSHKSKEWQGYAAMTAAAYAKDLLRRIVPSKIENERPIVEYIREVHGDIQRMQSNVQKLRNGQQSRIENDVLQWLTTIEYHSVQQGFVDIRQPHTGRWILEIEKFKVWRNAKNKTLFCHGIPGAGKTILSSIVISELSQQVAQDGMTRIAYVYCTYDRQKTQNADDMLMNLLKQTAQCFPSLPPTIRDLHEKHDRRNTRPTHEEIVTALCSLAEASATTYFVIDALDELTAEARIKLLSEIFEIQARANINIFLTSRPVLDVDKDFSACISYESIEVNARDEDIEAYLEGRMHELSISDIGALRETIKEKILSLANGMFLLVRLAFDLLLDKTTKSRVKDALENLERNTEGKNSADVLTETYTQTLHRIDAQPPGFRKLAHQALCWVAYAKRPLSSLELRHALAITPGGVYLDEDNIPEVSIVIAVCHGLITINSESHLVRLVHETTQDYFKNHMNVFSLSQAFDPNSYLAECCSTYLSLARVVIPFDFRSYLQPFSMRVDIDYLRFGIVVESAPRGYLDHTGGDPFFKYAIKFWAYHTKRSCLKVRRRVPTFMIHGGWVLSYMCDDLSPALPLSWDAVHIAARYGLAEMLNSLLDSGFDVEEQDELGLTPLLKACAYGHDEIIRVLLKAGADGNSTSIDGRSPLMFASAAGRLPSVQILLGNGVNLEQVDHEGRSALHHACGHGRTAVTDFLLSNGASVEKVDGYGYSPLIYACMRNHAPLVQVLLSHGAYPNQVNDDDWSPLTCASLDGHTAVIQMLLSNGADPDFNDNNGRLPLCCASKKGHAASVQALVDSGAAVNIMGRNGTSPLCEAIRGRYREVCQILIRSGADVRFADQHGDSIQLLAKREGYATLEEMLDNEDHWRPEQSNEFFPNRFDLVKYELDPLHELVAELRAVTSDGWELTSEGDRIWRLPLI